MNEFNTSIDVVFAHPDSIRELMDSLKIPSVPVSLGIPTIRFFDDNNLERRRIRRVWHPPHGSRFVEYGPEDEHWMRPLGLGTIEEIDEGPLLYFMSSMRFA